MQKSLNVGANMGIEETEVKNNIYIFFLQNTYNLLKLRLSLLLLRVGIMRLLSVCILCL